MNIATPSPFVLHQRHLLGIGALSRDEILGLLDLSEEFVELNRQIEKKRASLRGRTLINLFFEASTRTQASFELAGKRLGADVMNMAVASSSVRKGETLIDTAITLNAMHPDIIVVRHHASGAVELLAQKVDCSVINAGDGSHEHPTQALLDALTMRRNKGRQGPAALAILTPITRHNAVYGQFPARWMFDMTSRTTRPTTRHIVSINDLSDKEIDIVFNLAQSYLGELHDAKHPYRISRSKHVAGGYILASLFYEPSTRTRLSFESAMLA